MNKINREYLINVASKFNIIVKEKDNESDKYRIEEKLQPLLENYNEFDQSNFMKITNHISGFRNIHLNSLNDYFYYLNNWVNGEHTNSPLANPIIIEFNLLYPKLILAFYDIGLFQLIDKVDIKRLRSFLENRLELRKDSSKYYEEKVWVNSFLQSHYAYHDFKYVIDSYMYGLVMELIEKSKNKVVMYNVDQIILVGDEFDYNEILEPYFDYDVTIYDRGYFKDIRNYVLINSDEIISVGDESLIGLIKSSDMIARKDKVISNFIHKGIIGEENKFHGSYVIFERELLDYYFSKNSGGVNNPNFNIGILNIKYLLVSYIKMLYDIGIHEKENWSLILDKLSHLFNTIKIEEVSGENVTLVINTLFKRNVEVTPEENFIDYFYNSFNFIEFVDKIIK